MSEPRTEAGKRLMALDDWGTAALGDDDVREIILAIEAEAGSLDAAWAEAEAALPEGWHLSVDTGAGEPRAHACPKTLGAEPQVNAAGDTPAEALRALAARLRENR